MKIKVNVLEMAMGDVEDPEIYAAEPLLKWERSNEGKWVMEHSIDKPVFHIIPNTNTYGWMIRVNAWFSEKDYVIWKLKYE